MSERLVSSSAFKTTPLAAAPARPVQPSSGRRDFLRTTAAVGTTLATSAWVARSAYAGGDDLLRIGLVGCGGRGAGAAANALAADKNVKLVALGDTFADRLSQSLENLKKEAGDKVDVPKERCFVGFDAYQKVIDSGVDVVLLCTPPHFRPLHFQAAVAAGKHTFVEKPVAVDASGVRSVLATAELAKQKNLAVVSGLCYRYDQPKRETIARIHNGDIGDVLAINVNYNTGTLWMHPRQAGWSDMEWQVRNWLYFTWLSGDHNVEQHVHSLDKAAWVMRDVPPVQATGLGGRQVRVEPAYGNIYDHHAVVYEYANDVRLFAFCRQQAGCTIDVSDYVMGTKGTADLMRHKITGDAAWRYRGDSPNMYQVEHDELFASIRSGSPLNNSDYMIKSTMLAILGRMATYSGQTITWDQALQSKEDLSPPAYEWTDLAVAPVAMPGITTFV